MKSLVELKHCIMTNELPHIIVMVGCEYNIINTYIKQIANTSKLPVKYSDTVASIKPLLTAKTLFGKVSKLYVVKYDTEFISESKYFDELIRDVGDNIIIIVYTQINARSKFNKVFDDYIYIVDKMSESVMSKYIKIMTGLSDKSASMLYNIVDGSYDSAILECDKVKSYAYVHDISADKAFIELCSSDIIHTPITATVFDFASAVCSRNIKAMFGIEQILREDGVSAVAILSIVYTSLFNIMLVQSCDMKDVESATGLDKKQVYISKKYINKYDIYDLVYAVKLCSTIIADIKSGKITDKYAVRYFICQIL